MRRSLAVLGLAMAVGAGALSMTIIPPVSTEAVAGTGQTFVIPAGDGYGIAECVASGSSCGQVVADSWCEAQGFPKSASFGPADVEATGSIGTASRPISVTCAE